MNVTLFKEAGKFFMRHRKAILTTASIFGVVGSNVASAKAGYKFAIEVENVENETKQKLDKKEKYKLAAKTFALPAITTVATVGSIVATQRVNAKELAALGGAYTLLQNKYGSLHDAIDEIEDSEVVKKIQDKFDEKMTRTEASDKSKQISSTDQASDGKDVLNFAKLEWIPEYDGVYYEPISGRYFGYSESLLADAVNRTNEEMLNSFDVTLNDLYDAIDSGDLESNDAGYMLGWEFNSTGLIKYRIQEDSNRYTILRGQEIPIKTIEFMNGPQYIDY